MDEGVGTDGKKLNRQVRQGTEDFLKGSKRGGAEAGERGAELQEVSIRFSKVVAESEMISAPSS